MSVAFWSKEIAIGANVDVQPPKGYVLNVQNAALATNSTKNVVLKVKTTSIEGDAIDSVLCTLIPNHEHVLLQLVFGYDVPVTFYITSEDQKAKVLLSGYYQPAPEDPEDFEDEGVDASFILGTPGKPFPQDDDDDNEPPTKAVKQQPKSTSQQGTEGSKSQQQNEALMATPTIFPGVEVESNPPITILGYEVYFPEGKKPFPAQLAVISKTLQALSRKQNALLESPTGLLSILLINDTGTGKTLALLTSTLSWQKKEKLLAKQKASQVPVPSPAVPSSPSKLKMSVRNEPSLDPQKKEVPKIYFCSRTHSQLQQAISELKSCHKSYIDNDFTMSLLAGKIHLCINDQILSESRVKGVLHKDVLDELCKDAQPKRRQRSDHYVCPFTSSLGQSFLQAKVWDIEDAHHLGRSERSCPYFTSSKLAETADIVFAPYIYLIDPVIRSRSAVSLVNAVVVIDEAHNLEDTCRSAASIEASTFQFEEAIKFLSLIEKYGAFCREAAGGLREWIQKILTWIGQSRTTLDCHGFEIESRTWTGREALIIFEKEIDLTEETLQIYSQYFHTIVEFTDKEDKEGKDWSSLDIAHEDKNFTKQKKLIGRLFSNCRSVLERLFVVLEFMTSKDDPTYIEAYRVVIQRTRNTKTLKFELTLNIWCLSAHVAFKSLSSVCHSILLTSGTLSPLDTFERELGVTFPIRVEAQHVIDTSTQVFVRAINTFDNTLMTSSYINQSNLTYLDIIGQSLLSLTRITTSSTSRSGTSGSSSSRKGRGGSGVLAFFSSYSFLEKIKERWISTGFDQEFQAPGRIDSPSLSTTSTETDSQHFHPIKLFFEPKESEKLDSILKNYYETIDEGSHGLFLAVCRGKVSEGIDFSDNYARLVIVYGIPFPNLSSLQIKLKRNYLDEMNIKYSNLCYLTGDQWYEQQAFRAVNQAFGRCIRHIKDFGGIILCDPRYQKTNNQNQLSRWVRSNIINSHRLEDILLELKFFFIENYEKFDEYLEKLYEKRLKKKINNNSSMKSSSSVTKKRKKTKKMELSYDLGDTSGLRTGIDDGNENDEQKHLIEGQQTLSQIYGRYRQQQKTQPQKSDEATPATSIATSATGTSTSIPEERSQLINCLLQWDWTPPSLDGEIIQIESIGISILLEAIPSQLKYLQTRMSYLSLFPLQTMVTTRSQSSTIIAVRITDWTWPVSSLSLDSCTCTSSSSSSSTTRNLFCNCRFQVVEEWNPIDQVVYRLLFCPSHQLIHNNHQTQSSLLLAAKIIAVTDTSQSFLNTSYVNWSLLQEILNENNSGIVSPVIEPLETILDESSIDCHIDDITINDESFYEITHTSSPAGPHTSIHLSEADNDDEDFEPEFLLPRKKQDRDWKKTKETKDEADNMRKGKGWLDNFISF